MDEVKEKSKKTEIKKSDDKKIILENIVDKLTFIQQNLNVSKDQYNAFGKFAYRTVSDILVAVKPLLNDVACSIVLTDELINLENRFYVKATAKLVDAKSQEEYSTCAYARETESRSGMDSAQITGGASTYARKYALNGLLAIDDTVDPDSKDNKETATVVSKAETRVDATTGEITIDTKPAATRLIKIVKKSGE